MCENTNLCCDVCASTQVTVNRLPKIKAIIQTVNELLSSREKVAMLLRTSTDIKYIIIIIHYIVQWMCGSVDNKLASYVTHLCRPLGVKVK